MKFDHLPINPSLDTTLTIEGPILMPNKIIVLIINERKGTNGPGVISKRKMLSH